MHHVIAPVRSEVNGIYIFLGLAVQLQISYSENHKIPDITDCHLHLQTRNK